jgi:GT2 family glycosyltransferase
MSQAYARSAPHPARHIPLLQNASAEPEKEAARTAGLRYVHDTAPGIRRSALEMVGGFDERFTVAWREDSDLQFTLLERGMILVSALRAVVTHPIRQAP